MATRTTAWHDVVCGSAPVGALAGAVARGQAAAANGVRGSVAALTAGAIAQQLGRTVLFVVAHLDEADDALDDLEGLRDTVADTTAGLAVERFGALEVLPGESGVNLELLAERLQIVRHAVEGRYASAAAPPAGANFQPSFPGAGVGGHVLVAPIQALMQAVPAPDALDGLTFTLRAGEAIPPGQLLDWLDRAGYSRQDAVDQPGDFATRGGIIDIYPVAGRALTSTGQPGPISPIRLDYFGDEIESIHRIDADTMGSGEALTSVGLVGGTERQLQTDHGTTNLLELLPADTVPVLHETLELTEQARGYFERLTKSDGITSPRQLFRRLTERPHVELNAYSQTSNPDAHVVDLPVAALPNFDQDARAAIRELGQLAAPGSEGTTPAKVTVVCAKPAERDRLVELLIEHVPKATKKIDVRVGSLHRGFVWEAKPHRHEAALPHADHYFVPHHELFHRYETRRRVRRVMSTAQTGQAGDAFLDLEVGDYVVHVDHGIAKFTGLKTMRARKNADGEKVGGGEYLTLQFADAALLHVPAGQIDLIQKYVGGFQGRPPLSKLGGKRWKKQKESVADAVKDLAAELLRVQAGRETQPGVRYPADTAWQKEFEAEFPYDETEDQLAAIAAVKADMSETTPMDRLICGDVGFGKTEVALRGAFKCRGVRQAGRGARAHHGARRAARAHLPCPARRLPVPRRVAVAVQDRQGGSARRWSKPSSAAEVDVLIGTHRHALGRREVRRPGPGRHRRGAALRCRAQEQAAGPAADRRDPHPDRDADPADAAHVDGRACATSASLTTPPVDRRAIVTEVIPYSEERIKQAVIRELNRGGQCYFVHNRVHNLQTVADDLRRLAPDARIVIGHGQMPPKMLEEVMLTFMRREADVLVSTTIIESGIDIPTANTMFINQADHFGLAELHQLRGRVGRYKHRAYCYLLLPPDRTVNEVASQTPQSHRELLHAGRGVQDRDARPGDPRRGQPAGGRAVRPHRRGGLRDVLRAAGTGNQEASPRADHRGQQMPPRTPRAGPRELDPQAVHRQSDKHRMDAYRRRRSSSPAPPEERRCWMTRRSTGGRRPTIWMTPRRCWRC